NGPPQPDLEAAGANLLALCDAANTTPLLIQLHKDLSALVESRDWWHGKANEYLELLSDLSKSAEAAKTALKGRIKSIEYTGESSRRSDDAAVIDQLTSALKRSKKLLSDGRGNQVTRVARYVKDHPYARHPFLRPLRRGVIWAIRRLGRI
ncbi:hypothetical protein, partial [Aureimonas sp. Leaf460]|uniref:hypothetical protein n=2 Tax=unclassified Aureimonas TaxID=2615206 RepID=UPI00138F4C5C